MKILLVYPEYPNTYWSFKYALKFISRKASFPPLGLLTVASLLPREFELKLVDMNVQKLKDNDIDWADMVFISAMDIQRESVDEVVIRCRQKNKKTVAGGPLFTTQYKSFEKIDHFVLNEAEVTLPHFLSDLIKGSLKRVYTSKIRPDLSKVPLPSWSLIRFNKYATMLIQFSRGCPFNCEFCDIPLLNGRIPRTKSPEQVIREVQVLYDEGYRGAIFFVDDNFIGNRKEVKKMLPSLINWQKGHKYPFTFLTEASMDLADDERLMNMMSEANFNKVFLGIETPNIDSLKECGKFQNVNRDLAESVRVIQRSGMQVMGGFIVGFDNDLESIFKSQIDFIQRTGVVTAMVGLLNAIPQTPLWKRLRDEGRLLGAPTGSNTDGTLNFVPRMDREKLIEGYKEIISTIYSPKAYYKRVDTFLKNYKPKAKSRIRKKDVAAFFRSVWRIGIISKTRFRYWKLIIKTMLLRRKSFPLAVELAIIGMHFQKISRIVLRS